VSNISLSASERSEQHTIAGRISTAATSTQGDDEDMDNDDAMAQKKRDMSPSPRTKKEDRRRVERGKRARTNSATSERTTPERTPEETGAICKGES